MAETQLSSSFHVTTVEFEIVLVHFDRVISSDDVVAELNRLGLEPARMEHACALSVKYPDLQREYPIVFLGSVWVSPRGGRNVPYLDHWSDGRRLDLLWWGFDWDRVYRFAAVPVSA